LRQSRTLYTLTSGPKSGVQFTLRRTVTDALALRAIDDLIAEAEQRVEALEANKDR